MTLPPTKTWRQLSANVFQVVDGKRLLFESDNSLFQVLRDNDPSVELIRENVAVNMTSEEIHDDIFAFFNKLNEIIDVVR